MEIWASLKRAISGLGDVISNLMPLSRAIDWINIHVERVVKWLVLITILVSAGNAVSRKLFSLSSNAFLEIQLYFFSAVFLLAAGYTLLRGEHVKIDIIYSRFSRTTQILIEIFGTLFFLLPFCVITLWIVTPVAMSKFVSGEMSPNPGGLIFWPAWSLIPVGFTLLGLQGISELIKRIAFLQGRAPDPALAHTRGTH
jgi:TRAP-type mannitol/chloroaromatic compound transport system permease small subunit